MNDPTDTHVLGMCRDHNADCIARAMAGLLLAELPTNVLEHRTETVGDLVTRGAADLCRTYALDADGYALPIIGYALDHIGSYFPELEPPESPRLPPTLAGCDRRAAWTAGRLDDLHPLVRAALLRRISGDYEPVDPDSRDEVEQQIARHQRLFATIHGGVHRALRHFGGIDDAGHRVDPEAWQTAALDDLVKAIMTSIRANLSPVFSDVIVSEGLAFIRRHQT